MHVVARLKCSLFVCLCALSCSPLNFFPRVSDLVCYGLVHFFRRQLILATFDAKSSHIVCEMKPEKEIISYA